MLVQTHFPQRLSPARYDAFLASGWFRGSVMLYKMDLLCIEGDVRSVVNIRLDLEKHLSRKSQRKLIRKVEEKFTVTYGLAQPNANKEALYAQMKSRFKGFIHPTLNDYLNSGFHQEVFNTREVCVYDDGKLIAVSYFDCGEKSLASLVGLYDENYAEYSLGIYTMLKELQFGLRHGYRWYYPGYVLDRSSPFDYKLRLGEFEYYNPKQRWARFEGFRSEETKAHQLRVRLDTLRLILEAVGLPHDEVLYPLFSMGYVGYWNTEFVRHPLFLKVNLPGGQALQFGYDLDMGAYIVNRICESPEYDHLINMEASNEFKGDHRYQMRLLIITEHLMVVPVAEMDMLDVFIREAKRKWYSA